MVSFKYLFNLFQNAFVALSFVLMATGGSAGSYYHNTMGNIHYPIPTGYNTYGYQPIVVQPAVAQPVATPVVKYTKPVAAPVVKSSAYTEYNDEP